MQKYKKDGTQGSYGVWYDTDKLYEEVVKDLTFYTGSLREYNITSAEQLEQLPGGVTFSGGEPLLQMRKLKTMLQRLKAEHIHTAIETSLFAPQELVQIAIELIDLFYVDIKILDKTKCRKFLQGDVAVYLNNLDLLMQSGKPIVFRIPVIGGYTDDLENRKRVLALLQQVVGNVLKVEIIKEHTLGAGKYDALKCGGNDVALPQYSGVSEQLMAEYEVALKHALQIPIEVCRI